MAEAPYADFAGFYAQLWAPRWAAAVSPPLAAILAGGGRGRGGRPGRVLDLACGSGDVAASLAGRGFEVSGVEPSAALRELAAARPGIAAVADWRFGERLPFADARFDATVCLYDSLNYVEDLDRLAAVLAEAARVLRPGGTFVADVNTSSGHAARWKGRFCFEDAGGAVMCRFEADPERRRARMVATCFVPEGERWRRSEELHVQRSIDREELEPALRAAGLSPGYLGDGTAHGLPAEEGRLWAIARRE